MKSTTDYSTTQPHRSKRKQRPVTTIHVNIRPTVNVTRASDNRSFHNSKDFYSFSSILYTQHHNVLNKSSTVVHVSKKSTHASIVDSNYSPLPLQSSYNSWDNEDSTNKSEVINKTKEGRLDWTSFENEHHEKKKKKCTRKCVILSIITVVLLIIIATVVLAVLLTKPKTNQTFNRTAILRWNKTGITVAGVTGRTGNASNLLRFPFGIAIDYVHTLYITDTYNNRVQKYLRDASFGTTIAGQEDGTANTTATFLNSPCDVTVVDSTSDIYVADTFNHRIQFWANGSSVGITAIGNGSVGNSTHQFNRPYGITRDPVSGTLYISDTMNYRVLSLIPGQSSGTLVAGGNSAGSGSTQLSMSYGLHFDSASNSLFIPNVGTNSVVQWVLGASSWTRIAGSSTGVAGSTSTTFSTPADVTVDPMGNVYVADANNHRIQFFSNGQSTGETIAGITSTMGNASNLLIQPLSVALDSQLNLYVSDAGNNRIQKFLRY